MGENNNIELLEKLSLRVIEYLGDEVGLQVSDKFSIKNVEGVQSLYVSAIISISKDMCGTIGISVPKSMIAPITESLIFAKIEDSEIEEYAEDTISEVLNIILANVVQNLTVIKNGGEVKITTPSIVRNREELQKNKDCQMYISELNVNNEKVLLSYHF
jgi:CheY-specific phosphatase CheX